MNTLVLDIETYAHVPEPLFSILVEKEQAKIKPESTRSNNPKPETLARIEREYQEKIDAVPARILQDAALSPKTGRIVSIAVGLRTGTSGEWDITSSQALEPLDEPTLLSSFASILEEQRVTRIVTFNGRHFDIPFIGARAMVHGIEFPSPLPWYRWDKRHIDLCDFLPNGGLKDWSVIALGEGSVFEAGGSGVGMLVEAADVETLRAYNEDDVRKTIALYERISAVTRFS